MLRLRLDALFDKDVADKAVDEAGGDGDVGARPQHDARGGDNLKCIQHDTVPGLRRGWRGGSCCSDSRR